MLGWGRLTFLSPDETKIVLALKYEVHATGFTFTQLNNSTQRDSSKSLAETLSLLPTTNSDTIYYQASAVISTLPASPYDAFYGSTATGLEATGPQATFNFGENQLELQIKTPEALKEQPFAASPHQKTFFKNLNLTFTQTLNSPKISVVGTVVAVVLGEGIELTASLNSEDQLIFTKTDPNSTLTVPIQGWGEMDITSLIVKSVVPNISGLQTRYTFDEGKGDRIYDCAASNEPIDLTVKTSMPETVAWDQVGNLTLKQVLEASEEDKEEPKVLKAPLLSSDDDTQSSDISSASRLIEACTDTEEITIAAWLKPEKASQGGPARIVALSRNTGDRHFMLGHGRYSNTGGDSTQYRVRYKTTEHRDGELEFHSDLGTATTELTYVAFTRSKDDGSEQENARIYINGILNFAEQVEGSLTDSRGRPIWKDESKYKLVMGNVASFEQEEDGVEDNRAWVGQLHRIELYNRALSAQEVYQQYYPTLEATGQFRLQDGPTPLDTPLPATLTLEQGGDNTLELTVQEQGQRTVTPQFYFTSIDGVWRQILTDDPDTEDGFILDSGKINSVLWGNAVEFDLEGESTGQSGKFRLLAPRVFDEITTLSATNLFDSELDLKLEGLNTLTFLSIIVESLNPSEATVPWQIYSTTEMKEILLPRLRDGRLFDWAVDFKLLNPALGIENDKLVLKGTWLDQSLSLYGWRREGQFVMQGESSFSMPFEISLGPIFEPGTSDKIVEQVAISSVMNTILTLELTKLGFLARVSGSFEWTDEAETMHSFTVPTFILSRPPLTPNQILEAVLERLTAQADVIFANQYRHATDYYFALVENKPLIYLGKSNSADIQAQTTTLPQLFSTTAEGNNISSAAGIFVLTENADQSCTLTITPQGITQTDLDTLKTDYDDFIGKLDSNQNLIKGILTLVKTRIAQRIPLLVNQILDYYYGLDIANRAVDLQAGMRLRVDYQNYQLVHPAQSTANSGFVGSGTSYYDLNYIDGNGSTTDLIINFDAFLSQIQPYVTTDIATVGAGSSLDTFRVGYQKPYFRLVYPSQAETSAGSLEPGKAATLIGATSLTALDTKTDVVSFYFRGRATVIPEIAVVLQGQKVFVPVGTTLRQLLAQTVSLPSVLPGQFLLESTGKPRLSRLLHEGVSNQPSYRFINLEENIPVFDLPLVKGDRIIL
ncbi:MAG: LamG domain-containing protein [Symploca sp. SIO2B6]|nr:LamG domain-containing protein [Symploca sp. SIO2B6]